MRQSADGPSVLDEASGKTLGIVGFGNIGKKVVRRAAAFDMKIQYYDILRLTEAEEDALGVRFNVTLTPHTAGPTWDNWVRCFRNGFDNIQRVAGGDQPRWVVPELRSLLP